MDEFVIKGKDELSPDHMDLKLNGIDARITKTKVDSKDYLIWLHGFNSRHDSHGVYSNFPGVQIYVDTLVKKANASDLGLNIVTFTYRSHQNKKMLGRLDMDIEDVLKVAESIENRKSLGLIGDSYGARVALEALTQLDADYAIYPNPFIDINSFAKPNKRGNALERLFTSDLSYYFGEKFMMNLAFPISYVFSGLIIPYGTNSDGIKTYVKAKNLHWIRKAPQTDANKECLVVIGNDDKRLDHNYTQKFFSGHLKAEFKHLNNSHNLDRYLLADEITHFIGPFLKG